MIDGAGLEAGYRADVTAPLPSQNQGWNGPSAEDQGRKKRLLYNCTCYIIRVVEIVIDTSAILAVIAEQPEKADLLRLTRESLVSAKSMGWAPVITLTRRDQKAWASRLLNLEYH